MAKRYRRRVGDEDDWDPVDVLDDGLPPMPAHLALDEEVAVARWVGPRFGAVRWFVRYVEDDEDRLDDEISMFVRVADGWEESSGGGGFGGVYDDVQLAPPDVAPRFVSISGISSYGGSDVWKCTAVTGTAGAAAAWVEVIDAEGVTRMPIQSPTGLFIACSDGNARFNVRVLDSQDAVLLSEDVSPDPAPVPAANASS